TRITGRTIASSVHPSAGWRRSNNHDEAEIPNLTFGLKIVGWTLNPHTSNKSSTVLVKTVSILFQVYTLHAVDGFKCPS
ncbi:MAG: hypothetical protein M3120_01735, partial [Pseudomonadota bacterium]|nr:hypothetical protein [Pseudomonadota bacterium]